MLKKAIATALAVLWCVSAMLMPSAAAQEQAAAAQEQLDIEITVSGGHKLRLPVASASDKQVSFALVPINYSTAVRVIPIMEGGRVKFGVHLISTGLGQARTCLEKLKIPGEHLGIHFAEKGEIDRIDRGELSITFKIVEAQADLRRKAEMISHKGSAFTAKTTLQEGAGCRCGSCDEGDAIMMCCPGLNKCINCGSCGDVCCFPKPKDYEELM